jgi:hypothetical protein
MRVNVAKVYGQDSGYLDYISTIRNCFFSQSNRLSLQLLDPVVLNYFRPLLCYIIAVRKWNDRKWHQPGGRFEWIPFCFFNNSSHPFSLIWIYSSSPSALISYLNLFFLNFRYYFLSQILNARKSQKLRKSTINKINVINTIHTTHIINKSNKSNKRNIINKINKNRLLPR